MTEHEGRVVCADCLSKLMGPEKTDRGRMAGWAALAFLGLLLAWLVFYYAGAFLSRMPASFHGDA